MKFFKPKFWDKNQISFLSIFLYPISLLLKMFNFFRRLFSQKYKCSIPIFCVGNIYLGGTGKTSLSLKINEILKEKIKTCFINKNWFLYIKNKFFIYIYIYIYTRKKLVFIYKN